MADGKFLVGKPSGGVTTVTVADGAANTNLVLPERGTVSSVDSVVTDNAIARYDGTTGKLQNSGVVIDDNNIVKTNTFETIGETKTHRISTDNNVGGTNEFRISRYSIGGAFESVPFKIDSAGNVGITGHIKSGDIFIFDSGNLNDLKVKTQNFGTYPSDSVSNLPINDHGYLEVIVYMANSWVMQRFTTLGTSGVAPGRIFVRCLVNGIWSAWVEK